jgi:TPR repeat protein
MYKLGSAYAEGAGVERDYNTAIEWYTKAAEKGHTDAMYEIAKCYNRGNNPNRNEKLVAEWFGRAADKGHLEAMYQLAKCYDRGYGCDKNNFLAAHWYEKAAEAGHVEAMMNIAHYLMKERVNKENAMEWCIKAASNNLIDAMVMVAANFIDVDLESITDKFKRKVIKGSVNFVKEAIIHDRTGILGNLGCTCLHAMDAPYNPKLAVECFSKMAAQGNDIGKIWLGYCCQYSIGVERDIIKAVELYRQAAKRYNPLAISMLAFCYYNGDGVRRDERMAIAWLQSPRLIKNIGVEQISIRYNKGFDKESIANAMDAIEFAIEYNIIGSMTLMGDFLLRGLGFEKDEKRAVEWFEKAAEKGERYAMILLATCYKNGSGVHCDEKKAYGLLEKAAVLGHRSAMELLADWYEHDASWLKSTTKALKWRVKALTAKE